MLPSLLNQIQRGAGAGVNNERVWDLYHQGVAYAEDDAAMIANIGTALGWTSFSAGPFQGKEGENAWAWRDNMPRVKKAIDATLLSDQLKAQAVMLYPAGDDMRVVTASASGLGQVGNSLCGVFLFIGVSPHATAFGDEYLLGD